MVGSLAGRERGRQQNDTMKIYFDLTTFLV
jgi:hypothetical protein